MVDMCFLKRCMVVGESRVGKRRTSQDLAFYGEAGKRGGAMDFVTGRHLPGLRPQKTDYAERGVE